MRGKKRNLMAFHEVTMAYSLSSLHIDELFSIIKKTPYRTIPVVPATVELSRRKNPFRNFKILQ